MVCHVQSATSVRPHRAIPPWPPTADLTVDHAIGLFLDGMFSQGVRDTTLIAKGNQLRRFFGPVLTEPLRDLSTERLQQLVNGLAESRNKKTGAPLTVGTLATCRETAQRFTRWCTAQGRLNSDPAVAVKKKTLAQLHDEINTLRAEVFSMGQERQAPACAPRLSSIPRRHKVADLTIAAALALYLDSLVYRGRLNATVLTQKRQLRRFFGPVLAEPLSTLSTARLRELAGSLAAVRSKKTGAPLASETLCFCREVARSFTRWCTAQGRLSADPMMELGDSFAWLNEEASRLRADLEARRPALDPAWQPLHTREGAR